VGGTPVTGPWSMRGELVGEHLKIFVGYGDAVLWYPMEGATTSAPATWLRTSFGWYEGHGEALENGTAQLLLNAEGLQRGRVWLNGHEVGRYWNLERNDGTACPFGESKCPTQQFYHLPTEWLTKPLNNTVEAPPNILVFFEALGALKLEKVGLAVAAMQPGAGPDVPADKVVSCEF